MRFVLLLSFLCLSAANGRPRVLPERDIFILNELRSLGESLLDFSLTSMLNGTITVAQSIIDSRIAKASYIERLQTFVTQWRPKLANVSVEEYGKYSQQLLLIVVEETSQNQVDQTDLYAGGTYSSIKATLDHDLKQRLNAYRDTARIKMGQVSEGTKEADQMLMNSFHEFIIQREFDLQEFYVFLKELIKYQ